MSPEKLRSVRIDFGNPQKQLVTLKSGAIEIPETPLTFLGFKVGVKPIKIQCHRFWVELGAYDSSVGVKDPAGLIGFRNGTDKVGELKKFTITTTTYPYEICFDPKQIEDYRDFSGRDKSITFVRRFQMEEGGEIEEKAFQVDLNFIPAHSEPNGKLLVDKKFQDGFEYRSIKGVKVAELIVENDSKFTYSHLLDCTAEVHIEERGYGDSVYFDFKGVAESNPLVNREGGLVEEGEEFKSGASKKLSENKMKIKGLVPKNILTVPILIDLDRFNNPVDEECYNVRVSLEYTLNNQTVPKSLKKSIKISRDPRDTELMALLVDSVDRSSIIHCENDAVYNIQAKSQWLEDDDGAIEVFQVELGNHGENGTGAIFIENLAVNFSIDPNSSSTIEPWGKGSLSDILEFVDQDGIKYRSSEKYVNNVDSKTIYSCRFNNRSIKGIPGDVATIICSVRFDYMKLEDISEGRERTLSPDVSSAFNFDVVFKVEKNLGTDWMALDFGTSAIVAAFGTSGADETLIDLQASHKEVVTKRLRKPDMYTPENIPEFGTNFISSSILLRFGGIVSTDDISKDVVRLAPTIDASHKWHMYTIPYLKSLIGGDKIPNIDNRFDIFNYYERDGGTEKLFLEEPLDTNTVLENAYRLLIRDHIQPSIKKIKTDGLKTKELNKVIVTIPNVFTPRHVDYIKQLIQDEFKEFKKDYISFISESDAVACYYGVNGYELNKKRSESKEEYVLVYDMGAGTLDLTYFRIRALEGEASQKEVKIIGKIGKTTAGNYLDYVIADYIYTNNKSDFKHSLFGKSITTKGVEARGAFKNYVRNEIKPRLNDDEEFVISASDVMFKEILVKDITVTSSEIRKGLKGFIDINTREIFNNFFTLYNRIDTSSESVLKKGAFPIDTVIISGRSTQINDLVEAVKKEVEEWSGHRDTQYIRPDDDNKLKTLVVEGALVFANRCRGDSGSPYIKLVNKNLQARYGVIYEDPRRPKVMRFKELLNPNTLALNENKPRYRDGIMIYEYDTDKYDVVPSNNGMGNKVNLINTVVGSFVQSYSVDTAKDWNEGKFEYITKMFDFDTRVTGSGMVDVRVRMDKNNEMTVKIGKYNNHSKSQLKTDVTNNPVLKQSLWPYME